MSSPRVGGWQPFRPESAEARHTGAGLRSLGVFTWGGAVRLQLRPDRIGPQGDNSRAGEQIHRKGRCCDAVSGIFLQNSYLHFAEIRPIRMAECKGKHGLRLHCPCKRRDRANNLFAALLPAPADGVGRCGKLVIFAGVRIDSTERLKRTDSQPFILVRVRLVFVQWNIFGTKRCKIASSTHHFVFQLFNTVILSDSITKDIFRTETIPFFLSVFF